MDNALLVSRRLGTTKARTAVALKMPTHEQAATLVQPRVVICTARKKDICCFGGGFPCWSGRRLLGGIGISGGGVEEDMLIARRAMAQLAFCVIPSQQPVNFLQSISGHHVFACVLVINCGSSSTKFSVIPQDADQPLLSGLAERLVLIMLS